MLLHNQKPTQTSTLLNKLKPNKLVTGMYRISNKRTGKDENGDQVAIVDLHDNTGSKVGQCEPKTLDWYQNQPYQLVSVKAYVSSHDHQEQINILEIEPASRMGVIEPFMRLPKAFCAQPYWLDRLIKIRQSIQSPGLGRFLDTVFSDDEVALAFLTVPGSSNFHHNHLGGLLQHSVEVADIVSKVNFKEHFESEIAIVAALLHDIGKVKTLKPNLKSSDLGRMVSHDALTLEVCAVALKALDNYWPDASYTMRHVWTCASPGARYGFQSNCAIAIAVHQADRLSAHQFDEQKAFNHHGKNTGLAWFDKKFYSRPSAEPTIENRRQLCTTRITF